MTAPWWAASRPGSRSCSAAAELEETELRDLGVDTADADPSVQAIELDGGSDLTNVDATNQPGIQRFAVLSACVAGKRRAAVGVRRRRTTSSRSWRSTASASSARRRPASRSSPRRWPSSRRPPHTLLRIKRSIMSLPETSTVETVSGGSRVTIDSSLVTGGGAGIYATDDALISNTTIDAGQAGVSDPLTPSLFARLLHRLRRRQRRELDPRRRDPGPERRR